MVLRHGGALLVAERGLADDLSAQHSVRLRTPNQGKPACARRPNSNASSKPQSRHRRPRPGPGRNGGSFCHPAKSSRDRSMRLAGADLLGKSAGADLLGKSLMWYECMCVLVSSRPRLDPPRAGVSAPISVVASEHELVHIQRRSGASAQATASPGTLALLSAGPFAPAVGRGLPI